MYKIAFEPPAEKFLKKCKDKVLKQKYLQVIYSLAENPYNGKHKTGDLAGIYGIDIRYNAINYELAYRIVELDDQIVVVIMCGTRENFYSELKRYLR